MAVRTVVITIDDSTGLTGRDIGKMIQRCTNNVEPRIEVTATPTTIDVRFEKVFSEITVEGRLYEKIRKVAKERNLTPEQILTAGAKRYGEL
jgi:hypothetical protein